MDGDLTEDRPSDGEKLTYSQVFDKCCPVYLAMGMSWENYWDGDPLAVKHYREADRLRQERMNEQAWLTGMYVYSAIADLTPAINPFSKARPREYMKQPISLRPPAVKTQKQENTALANGRAKMQEFMLKFNSSFAAKHKAKEGGESDADS